MLGWIRDPYDSRDKLYKLTKPVEDVQYVNLISDFPQIFDQLTISSCVAQGSSAQFFNIRRKCKMHEFVPSRLMIYFEGRREIGMIMKDSGMRPRDAMKIMTKIGACDEKLWPYIISKFKDSPPAKCYEEAEKHQLLEYHRLGHSLNEMKACLIEGYPFGAGIDVFESMMSKEVSMTGWVPMPKPKERNLGGHYVVVVGFDEKAKVFILRNSWGTSWGMGGHFVLNYEYLLNDKLSDDFWTLRQVEE